MTVVTDDRCGKSSRDPLNICLLTYRGNPASGGQGVYVKYLSKALRELGHRVDVLSGPPYPLLDQGIRLHKLPSLDLYNPDHLFKPKERRSLLSPINAFEFLSMCLGGFPEPLTFGLRAYRHFRRRRPCYDIVHDNQCLSYGLWGLKKMGFPVVATVHHPITVDRAMELAAADTWKKRLKVLRWYSFIGMQRRVIRRLSHLITVSEASRRDISREFNLPIRRFRVVPNGINTEFFYPLPDIPRHPHRLLATNSADIPLKGLAYLLEAVAAVRRTRRVELVVIGRPKKNGEVEKKIRELGIGDIVSFKGRIPYEAFAEEYARATVAVIPSLYEGFGMPAGEAMACGVPVISTKGGALPEVVGDAGILVPPADARALAEAILKLLGSSEERERLGKAGRERVGRSMTWRHAAEKTVETYREAIHAHH